jgi:hypothetical protein
MKELFLILTFVTCNAFNALVMGQDSTTITFLETKDKKVKFYIHLTDNEAYVYKMGRYWNKALSREPAYSITKIDTLIKQINNDYKGKWATIFQENNTTYLEVKLEKTTKYPIETAKNNAVINKNLNSACIFDGYTKMCRELESTYPLSNPWQNNVFSIWESVDQKDQDYIKFRPIAAQIIATVHDSISKTQTGYNSTYNFIRSNLTQIEYTVLKDSLQKLQAEYVGGYYKQAIIEIARKQPTYYLRLAEDLPKQRSYIFYAVEDDVEIHKGLKAVEGHDSIKKAFFKDVRFNKFLVLRVIAPYALIGGLILWLKLK